MRRPLLPVAIIFASGILLARSVVISPWLTLVLSALAALIAILFNRLRLPLLALGILLAGWTHYALRTSPISPFDLRRVAGAEPMLATLRGKLAETPSLRVYQDDETPSWRTLCRVEVIALRAERGAWQPAYGTVAITTPGLLTNIMGGQIVEVTGVLDVPRGAAAEGLFNYQRYLAEQGIYFHLRAGSERDWNIVRSPTRPGLADRFREWARRELSRGLPVEDESLRLEWALTLGWKTALTEKVSEPFIRAATYHIFAVDGLRMAILFGIFFSLFRAVGLSRAICGAALLPLIWFYVALTGWPASAIRATVMLTVVIAGWILRRPTDLLNSLFAAAFIILVWEPRQLFQAGFQLSFVVVLCILLLIPPFRNVWHRLWSPDPLVPARLHPTWRRWFQAPGRCVSELLLTSLAAWIGSIPLVACYFNLVTPVSTPANIVAVPLCALVLMSNLGSLICAAWLPWLAILLNHAGWFLMELIRITSNWFASWPKAYFYCQAPTLWTAVVYYVLVLAAGTGWLFRPGFRRVRLASAALVATGWLVGWWGGHSITKLTAFGAAGGYSLYCDFPGKKQDLLIDCGSTNGVELITKPFLRAQGVNRLPSLALTHGDLRQVGGAMLIDHLFGPVACFVGPLPFRSVVYRQTLRWFDVRKRPVQTIGRGDQVAGWSVLHPDPVDQFSPADDKTLVLTRTIKDLRVMFLSDLGRPGQEALLQRSNDLRADILIAGLPVKPEALSDGLLDAIRPRLIIVCDSEFPARARASPGLRERLARRPIAVVYLRLAGAVTMEFIGHSFELRTARGDRMRQLPEPGPAAQLTEQ